MSKIVVANESQVIERLTSEISKCAQQAIANNGVFRVGLSGGSVLNFLCKAVPHTNSDLSKWKFFFCDERYVDETDPESTYGAYKSKLVPQTNLQLQQFVPINIGLPLDECAAEYERKLRKEFGRSTDGIPEFDLLLLGMGPDGHTCSLFPNHALLKEKTLLIAPIADSPKPPPQRVTMTFPLINNAKCCIFAMCGSGKAEMVKRVFVDKEDLPAGRVLPKNGELIVILDAEAGKYVQ
ncbi:PREDICTED: probable 6-phosphogluconolactonase [Rhagoletis zephyria]|uniref:probable 6-phosphogluconolactonase n=1 Tax=Rhagoletis zephyria TaxID=28612 RepID=UPI0008119B7F|nr:PREDICTED: probable 6-phosphogluconolactonase [Rhagoletis zephyria]XP_017484520.1 PREDICTED: probable 6-phosphogluconolactonase [Rhagoletis zephyria]